MSQIMASDERLSDESIVGMSKYLDEIVDSGLVIKYVDRRKNYFRLPDDLYEFLN